MGLYESFGTDKTAEINGVWVTVGKKGEGDDAKDIRFLLARQNGTNKKFQAFLDKAVEPYRQLIQMEKAPVEILLKIARDTFCNTILLNWENVDDKDGKELPFNVANAVKLMKDLPDLYDMLDKKSKASVTFADKSLDVAVKN